MSWSGFPLAAGDDWARLDVLNQIVAAYNERAQVVRDAWGATQSQVPDLSPVAVGQDVSSVSFIRTLQDRVDKVGTYFRVIYGDCACQHTRPYLQTVWSAGVQYATDQAGDKLWRRTRRWPREITTPENPGTDGSTGNRARVKTGDLSGLICDRVAGVWVLSPDQLTPPDVLQGIGSAQVGDYLGPWIFNDLYYNLNLCHSCVHAGYKSEHGQVWWEGTGSNHLGSAGVDQAKADALADYQQRAWSAYDYYAPQSGPYAMCHWTPDSGRNNYCFAWLDRFKVSYRFHVADNPPSISKVWFLIEEGDVGFIYPGPDYEAGSYRGVFYTHGDDVERGYNEAVNQQYGFVESPDYDLNAWKWNLAHYGPLASTDELSPNTVHPSTTPSTWSSEPFKDYGWLCRSIMQATTYTFEYADGLPGGGVT